MATIAIIEDDKPIAEMYKLKFEAVGFKIVMAGNGVEGLELIQKTLPDLVLLDIMMPEMRGDEMLTKMRQTDWGKNIKVVILTNVSKDEFSEEVANFGVLDFIVKAHFTPQQVVDTVKAILGQAEKSAH